MIKKRKAIFLDRDGVLNKRKSDYVKSIDELMIFPNIGKSIKKFNDNNFLVVVITNQSAINRGLATFQNIHKIHHKIEDEIFKSGAVIDKFYICPHRPNEFCECRKPKSGMLLKAISELKIDPKSSWMIGDSDTDIIAGKHVGCNTIKIENYVNLEIATKMIFKT